MNLWWFLFPKQKATRIRQIKVVLLQSGDVVPAETLEKMRQEIYVVAARYSLEPDELPR